MVVALGYPSPCFCGSIDSTGVRKGFIFLVWHLKGIDFAIFVDGNGVRETLGRDGLEISETLDGFS